MISFGRWGRLESEMAPPSSVTRRVSGFAAGLATVLVVLEMLIMISPFALYYYGVYGPIMDGLHGSAWTAWLPAFFLPHLFSFAHFPDLVGVGFWTFAIAFLAFLVTAAQLYYVKLWKKSVARGWLYAKIRHPQYALLAIAGFGLLIAWPRYLILLLYVSMLFAYGFLASNEERRMELAFGDRYRAYRDRTWKFLPWDPCTRLLRSLFGRAATRPAIRFGLWPAALLLSVGIAFELRAATVRLIPVSFFRNDSIVGVPLAARLAPEMSEQIKALLGNLAAIERFERRPGSYVVHIAEDKRKLHHLFIDLGMRPAEARKFDVSGPVAVISRATTPDSAAPIGAQLLAAGTTLEPLFLVETPTTLSVPETKLVDLTIGSFRGNRAAPLF